MEYLIAVAIVKNLDGTAEVKTKSIKIILWFLREQTSNK
jgi:hypothetical protein